MQSDENRGEEKPVENKEPVNKEIGIKAEHIPIYKLEQEIYQLPRVEMPVFHDFCKGIYARTLVIPAGTVLTGAIHKYECFFVVRSGSLLITTDNGTVQADSGFMSITKPETKRAGFALVDTLVTTFHANPEELRDPDEMWNHFTVPAPGNILEILEKTKLEEA
jgi:hypothetical protein